MQDGNYCSRISYLARPFKRRGKDDFLKVSSLILILSLVFGLSLYLFDRKESLLKAAVSIKNHHNITVKFPMLGPKIRKDASQRRYQAIKKQAKKSGKVNLLFLGDSITHGWKYGSSWSKFYNGKRALNAGVSADRIEHLLWRIKETNLYSKKPKLVVLLIGINNLALNTSKEIAGGIFQITREILRRSPNSKILILGIFPSGRTPFHHRRAKIIETNALLGLFADNKRIFFLDIGSRFLDKNGYINADIMHDYLHLTGKGYEIWASAMGRKLRLLLQK